MSDLVQVQDFTGSWIWVPYPKIETKQIPEEWDSWRWYIAQVIPKPMPPNGPRIDQLAAAEIMALGHPAFMPVASKEVRLKRSNGRTGKGWVKEPRLLFPGYLLVGLGSNDERQLLEVLARFTLCRYVRGFVSRQDRPIRLRRKDAQRLIEALNSGWYDESAGLKRSRDCPGLNELARVNHGPLESFTGTLEKYRVEKTGDKRVVSGAFVRLSMLGGDRLVEIPIDSLERAE